MIEMSPALSALRVAGVDEVGRGPLAGPVVAAAVILHSQRPIAGLADSKTLTPKRRKVLSLEIREHAQCWAIAEASVEEIDRINILQATLLAMSRAVKLLTLLPQLVLVDGNHLPLLACEGRAIIGGDKTEPSISAASIIAKVYRDALMEDLHREYPDYGFDGHKGYPSAAHLRALKEFGASPAHRRSFGPVRLALRARPEVAE